MTKHFGAYRWHSDPLGDLPGGGNASHANATPADGSVVVGFGTGFEEARAFRPEAPGAASARLVPPCCLHQTPAGNAAQNAAVSITQYLLVSAEKSSAS